MRRSTWLTRRRSSTCSPSMLVDQRGLEASLGQLGGPLAAEVVVPPLEHRHDDLSEGFCDQREVALGELLLEGLGGGGDHDRSTELGCGDEVGQGLARAGAGGDEQVAVLGEGLLDRLGHGHLAGPLLATAGKCLGHPTECDGHRLRRGERRHGEETTGARDPARPGWSPPGRRFEAVSAQRGRRPKDSARGPERPRRDRLGPHPDAHRLRHGRQRTLGEPAGPPEDRGPRRRRGGAGRRRRRGAGPRGPMDHHVRLLDGELATARRRGPLPHGLQRVAPHATSRRAQRQGRADPLRRASGLARAAPGAASAWTSQPS